MTDETTPPSGVPDSEASPTSEGTAAGVTPEASPSPQPRVAPPMGDAGIPAPAPAKRRGVLAGLFVGVVGRSILGVVVFGLFMGGAAIWDAMQHERQLDDLQVGQCVNVPDKLEFATVKGGELHLRPRRRDRRDVLRPLDLLAAECRSER